MKILILEDDPARHKAFRRNLIGNEVIIVEHTHEAIQFLEEQDWDALFLDHDLGGKVYCESGPGTGWEVAEWLSKNEERLPQAVITHSFHDLGRANIIKTLPIVYDAPGAWVKPLEVIEKAIDSTISEASLRMLDSSMKNFAKGIVSAPIDLDEFKDIIDEN